MTTGRGFDQLWSPDKGAEAPTFIFHRRSTQQSQPTANKKKGEHQYAHSVFDLGAQQPQPATSLRHLAVAVLVIAVSRAIGELINAYIQ